MIQDIIRCIEGYNMLDLKIDDIAFRSYLKRRMDELSKKYK